MSFRRRMFVSENVDVLLDGLTNRLKHVYLKQNKYQKQLCYDLFISCIDLYIYTQQGWHI